jgi:alpha-ribazole phosphatase
MSVWLVRHPRVLSDHRICAGRFEWPLAESFDREVVAIREQLPWEPNVVWSAPSMRCQRAAVGIGGVVEVDARLAELNFGQWEGRRWADIYGAESKAWTEDPWTRRPPEGETGDELEKRVAAVRAEILAKARSANVAVVTHDGVIRAWRRIASNASRAEAAEWSVPCGTVWPLD